MNQLHKNIILENHSIPHFNFEKFGIKGVGKYRHPILSLDRYIDHSNDDMLHQECCLGLAKCNDFKMAMVYGAIPPEELKRLNAKGSWTEILQNLDKFDINNYHKNNIRKIMQESTEETRLQTLYKYCYFSLGAVVPWFFACYLKHNSFVNKTNHGQWTSNAEFFPNIIKYIEKLPFKTIGRVLFFTTYPNAGVVMHRDSVVANHKDHNINLFFSGGWRPSFVYDEIKKEKIYLEQNARSYFFNNRDYHGVEPENNFRYTLRIDGTFTDEFCEELGLKDGYTWNWQYE